MVAARVLANVDHFCAGVGLLAVVGQRHRIKLAHRVVALQNAARVLPGNGRAGLYLGPRDLGVHARALAALGHEVVNSAAAFLVAGVPVLHGGVLDVGVVERDQFHHRRVQLVLVANGRRAAFEVTHRSAFVGDDQRPLELPRLRCVDAEVGRQFHGAAHALGHVHKRAVGKDRRVERGKKVVGMRNHRAQVLLHQVGVVLHRLRERAEDHAHLRQLALEGRRHGDAVKHRVHGHAGQQLLLVQRECPASRKCGGSPDRCRPASPAQSSAWAPSSRRCPGSRWDRT